MTEKLERVFVLRNPANCQALYAFLKANWEPMATDNRPLMVRVDEYKSKRSREQNKRYWAIIEQIAAGAWFNGKRYSGEAWHHAFRLMFIGGQDTPNGAVMPLSTTDLNVADFNEYMTKVEAYAATELAVELI